MFNAFPLVNPWRGGEQIDHISQAIHETLAKNLDHNIVTEHYFNEPVFKGFVEKLNVFCSDGNLKAYCNYLHVLLGTFDVLESVSLGDGTHFTLVERENNSERNYSSLNSNLALSMINYAFSSYNNFAERACSSKTKDTAKNYIDLCCRGS